jgi:hypothetical protein
MDGNGEFCLMAIKEGGELDEDEHIEEGFVFFYGGHVCFWIRNDGISG